MLVLPGVAGPAWAQQSDASTAAAPAAPSIAQPISQDIVTLHTTSSRPKHHSYFRLTHRFARDLRGPFGELARSAFGLDDGAIIGLEYRFAPADRFQIGAHRSMLFKTIQVFMRHDTIRQSASLPAALSLVASVEGTNNLRAQYSQSLGAIASRTFGDRLAVYVSPTLVWNSQIPVGTTGHEAHDHDLPESGTEDAPGEQTFVTGAGARLRLMRTVFLAGEVVPRLGGFSPGDHHWSVAIEKRTDGHQFQINFSNSFGTTTAQIARCGQPGAVYLGFNLGRTF